MSNVESAKSGLMEERPQRMPTPTISINPASKFKDPIARSNGKRTKKKNIPHQHSPKFSAENENRNIFSHILKKRLELDTTTTSYRFDDTIEKEDNCMSRLIKLTFSTPGLVAMVIIYSVMGATIFPLIEAPKNISKTTLIAKSREECLKELWTITEKLNILYESNWTLLVHEQLRRFEGTVVAATRHSAASLFLSTDISENALSQFDSVLTTVDNEYPMTWSFSEALLYSVTVITTIGHGSLTPRTAGGKIATILYAFIGVPLMLMCLSSLGTLLADCLRRTYSRLFCHHHREYNDASGEKVIGHRQKNHLDVEKEPNDDRADVFKKQEYINCDGAQDDKYRVNF
uniref:Potassium channel domain-containing protein n=1 Tax=Glossina brevipalpis TaxID=37001 RepID=A0A1A9WWU3_9MUSC